MTNKNTCILYNEVNDVYQKLLEYCAANGFKVKEINDKFYLIKAKKSSIFFWRTMKLELEILLVEKRKVQITVILFKNRKRQPELEEATIIAIEGIF
ncbi:hypothetical protein BH11BAC1_BH11BAC1_20940 [soil metagenome]